MSQTTVNLGYVLKNRGEYIASPETRYYHDNVVQYNGSSFIADPVDYDPETNPLAYVTTPPYDADPNQPNEGWKVFASDAAYVNSFMTWEENPEWVEVHLDAEQKILYGVKTDGEFFFGAGCPQQVKDYIEEKISSLSLDEYEDIVAFLADYLGSDTTLKAMIDEINAQIATKVDKEEGKSLIDADYALSQSTIENPEYINVELDAESKILSCTKKDGSHYAYNMQSETIDAKVDKKEGKSLIDAEYANGVHYIENPEFVYVKTDSEDKILWAIRTDGDIFYGAGVPSQVVNYINEKISELSLDEYEDIVAFLNDLEKGDKTLQTLLDEKVDKENGKSLVDAEYADGVHYIENPEFAEVKLDSENKIIWAIKTDGSIYYGAGIPPQIIDYIQQKIDELSLDEYEDIVTFLGNLIDGDTLETLLDAKADKVSGKSLIDTEFATSQEVVTNPEYLQVTTDSEGKILSYRDSQGIMHEEVGLQLDNDALQHFYQMLKDNGYVGTNNWSDTKFLELPIPQVCAIVNIGTNSQASAKGVDIITTIEYWDKLGNYFKKPIKLNAQGSSSMAYNIKNQAIDFTDGSELKFGNWPAFDSFHIKKYFIDVFRGQCIVCYWLGEQVYQTRPVMQRRPWSYLQNNSAIDGGYGDFAKDYDSGALAHPDGFPIHLFFNGKDAGIYAFNIKKARNNYNCKKNKQNQIILDGILGYKFWNANGDLRQQGEEGGNIWHDFEIRNPKIDKDIDGNKYDGDNPKEPSEDWATCKSNIERLTEAVTAVNAESTMTTKKNKFAEYFNVPFLIDYDLISQVTYNYDGYRKNWIWLTNDGNLWCPTIYDMDSVFGQHWNGASYVTDSISSILGEESGFPTKLLHSLYKSECDLRYKELRDCGIFTADNICNLLDKWISTCGYDNLKNDIENIATSPYLENGNIVVDENNNPILIPNTPSYRDGSKTYLYQPTTNGWYNSIQRVYNWLIARIATLDSYYNYNQN